MAVGDACVAIGYPGEAARAVCPYRDRNHVRKLTLTMKCARGVTKFHARMGSSMRH